MAVDTRHKRFSMMNLASRGHRGIPLFEADGSVDTDDRQQTLNCYSGIAFSPLLSASDRFALMNARVRSIHVMPMFVPDNTIGEDNRLHLIDLYGRFGADSPVGAEEMFGEDVEMIPSYGISLISGRFA